MVITPRRVGIAVTVILVVVAAVTLWSHVASNDARTQGTAAAASVKLTVSATPSPSVRSLVPATPAPDSSLTQRAREFFAAYYYIKPNDTAASRRQRLRTLAPPAVLQTLDLELSTGSLADQARVRAKLTLQGQPNTSQLVADPVPGHPGSMRVILPVTIASFKPDGSLLSSYQKLTTSVWRKLASGWTIQQFTEGGDSG